MVFYPTNLISLPGRFLCQGIHVRGICRRSSFTTVLFRFKTESGTAPWLKDASLKAYSGKVLLIVNVASKCGYTRQYKTLEAVHRKYADKGFTVLGFPSNDFGGQEPGNNAEIKQFCTSKFDVSFPMFDR